MKHGFTIIEVLITSIILGIFMIVCIPYYNKLSNSFNYINDNQINCLNKINFYQKVQSINNNYNFIYYQPGSKTIIKINEHKIIINENKNLTLDNVSYNVRVYNITVDSNYILLNILIDDKKECVILKGEVYEISSSENI